MMHYGVVCTEAGILGQIPEPPKVKTVTADNCFNAQTLAMQMFAEKVMEYAKDKSLYYAHYNNEDREFKVYSEIMVCIIACIWLGDEAKESRKNDNEEYDADANDDMPMMRQYKALKREVPAGAILMFRLGDFYEMFGEDAVIASPILGATLAKRGKHPMCGVPFHAINAYLKKLIETGRTVALADVVEESKSGNIPRREITRIVTPATFEDEGEEEQE